MDRGTVDDVTGGVDWGLGALDWAGLDHWTGGAWVWPWAWDAVERTWRWTGGLMD
jgi:hypothetical protein